MTSYTLQSSLPCLPSHSLLLFNLASKVITAEDAFEAKQNAYGALLLVDIGLKAGLVTFWPNAS